MLCEPSCFARVAQWRAALLPLAAAILAAGRCLLHTLGCLLRLRRPKLAVAWRVRGSRGGEKADLRWGWQLGAAMAQEASALLVLFLASWRAAPAFGQDVGARPSSIHSCSCPDPILGDKVCYEPVCPSGYYKCCSSCSESLCSDVQHMEYSWRGIRECILCPPGDFCDGCDTLKTCPASERVGREGPRVTPPGATRVADCETCGVGMEASFYRDVCVDKFKDECLEETDEDYMERCMRHCTSPDIARRKELNSCERMQCQIYCAKQFDTDFGGRCLEFIRPQCLFLTGSPDAGNALVVGAGLEMLEDCDVDCNEAGRSADLVAGFLMALMIVQVGNIL